MDFANVHLRTIIIVIIIKICTKHIHYTKVRFVIKLQPDFDCITMCHGLSIHELITLCFIHAEVIRKLIAYHLGSNYCCHYDYYKYNFQKQSDNAETELQSVRIMLASTTTNHHQPLSRIGRRNVL